VSENNREGKRTARARLQEERRRQESKAKRLRLLTVLGVVVAVLAIAAVVGVLVSNRGGGDNSASDKPVATPKGTIGEGRLVIPVGRADAKAALTVYEDFRCPACGQFEKAFHGTIARLEDQGRLRTEYHLVAFIDNNLGGSGSKNAANAAACAQDAGAFREYHDVLYANQPPETQDAFGNKDTLIRLAQRVPALKGNKAFEACVDNGTYDGWVKKSQNAFNKSGYTSTPTILLNGENLNADQQNPLTPQRLEQKVDALQKKAPSPTGS
jgi:protein-disulfide isomerase